MKNVSLAFRFIFKVKSHTFTRVFSLTLGLVMATIILSYVNYSFHYDRDLPDSDRIYQMFTRSSEREVVMSTTQDFWADELTNLCPKVEQATRMAGIYHYDFHYNQQDFPVAFAAIDTNYFKVMDYGVILGSVKDLALNPNNILISESLARKLFGEDNPMGKVIQDHSLTDRFVCGVYRDMPINSVMGPIDLLISLDTPQTKSWGLDYFTFIKLQKGAKTADLQPYIKQIEEQKGVGDVEKAIDYSYIFAPLDRAIMTAGTKLQYMRLFNLLAALVLFVSCLNYVMVTISTLVNRSKTIALLRCHGAGKDRIFGIFLWETLFVMLISLVLGFLCIFAFNGPLYAISEIPLTELFGLRNLWVTGIILLVIFVIAGCLPAAMFASVPPTVVFRAYARHRNTWKKALLCFQLICISFALFFLLVSIMQFHRLTKGEQGYEHENLVFVNFMAKPTQFYTIETELAKLEGIEAAGTAYCLPIYGYRDKACYDEQSREALFACRSDNVSPFFFNTMQMRFTEGRAFTIDGPITDVVVTREYVRLRKWEGSALGRIIIDQPESDAPTYRIVGVVEDIRTGGGGKIEPIVFHPLTLDMQGENMYYGGCRTMIRLKEYNAASLETIKAFIKNYPSVDNYHITVYDDIMADCLKGDRHFRSVLFLVSGVTLLIALVGLIGYLNDEVRRRRKEIAVRKVNGAVMKDIIMLIARSLSIMTIPCVVFGLLAGSYAARLWLQQFTNRTPLYFWIFIVIALFVMALVYTVSFVCTRRVASQNPVEYLKSE